MKRSSTLQIIAAILCATSFGLSISLLFPALTFKMEAIGYSGTIIGTHAAFSALASIIIAPLMPSLVNKLGFAKLLRISLILAIFAIISIGLTDAPILWLLPRFIFSLAVTTIFILSESWINTVVLQNMRGRIIAIYAACLSIGFAGGPVLLAVIGTDSSNILYYTLLCLTPVLFAALVAPVDIGEMHRINVKSLLEFFKKYPLPLAAAFIFGIFETSAFTFLPLWGLENGHSAENSALLITMLNIGIVMFQLPLGMLADKFSKRKIIKLCVGALILVSLILILYAENLPIYQLFAIVFIWGGISAALYTIGLVWLMEQLSANQIIQGNSYFVWMYTIGMLIAPQSIGIIHDAAPHTGMLIGIAFTLCMYFFSLFLKKTNVNT